eukprot:2662430-Pyramimonas_sp.AAC.1
MMLLLPWKLNANRYGEAPRRPLELGFPTEALIGERNLRISAEPLALFQAPRQRASTDFILDTCCISVTMH